MGEGIKREVVVRKDLSSGSISVPSAKPLLDMLSFCEKDTRESTISDMGGRNSFTGCVKDTFHVNQSKMGEYNLKNQNGNR